MKYLPISQGGWEKIFWYITSCFPCSIFKTYQTHSYIKHSSCKHERAFLWQQGIKAPIIALTAHGSATINNDVKKEHISDFLSKPLTEEKLRLIIKRWLMQGIPFTKADQQLQTQY